MDHRCQVTVIGEENVPKDQAVLYVANHRSYFDILLTYSRCPIRTGYVAKKEMERYPLLSNWMRNLYCLFLDREDIKTGTENHPSGGRLCKIRNLRMHLPGRNQKQKRR